MPIARAGVVARLCTAGNPGTTGFGDLERRSAPDNGSALYPFFKAIPAGKWVVGNQPLASAGAF